MSEYSVLTCLPDDGIKCLCFGHKTYCCKDDMEQEPGWHEVTFKFEVSEYKIKKEIPLDPEETILEYCKIVETWEIGPGFQDGQVFGVTKWKPLPPKAEE
jgi:hypothetical protein